MAKTDERVFLTNDMVSASLRRPYGIDGLVVTLAIPRDATSLVPAYDGFLYGVMTRAEVVDSLARAASVGTLVKAVAKGVPVAWAMASESVDRAARVTWHVEVAFRGSILARDFLRAVVERLVDVVGIRAVVCGVSEDDLDGSEAALHAGLRPTGRVDAGVAVYATPGISA